MAIKMRLNKKDDAVCDGCGCGRNDALDVFDVMIGDYMLTVCDHCSESLFNKTLRATCYTNGRVKMPKDTRVINMRHRKGIMRPWE